MTVAVHVGIDSEHRVVDAVLLIDPEQRLRPLVALHQQPQVVLQGDRDRFVQIEEKLPVRDVQFGFDRLGDPGRAHLHLRFRRRRRHRGQNEDSAERGDDHRGF